jgi:hypothetical protein
MERGLAAAGISRNPADTPFEYLARVLATLSSSAAAAHTLTDLFEWAMFSGGEISEEMKAAAISALLTIREEATGWAA